jgi:hypothetical protein
LVPLRPCISAQLQPNEGAVESAQASAGIWE